MKPLVIVVMCLLAAAAAGQTDQLGPHSLNKGCVACHTPHNTGRLDTTATRPFAPGTAGSPFAPVNYGFTWQGSGTGLPQAGNVYLWNRALSQVTYKTWDGSNISSTGVTGPSNAVVHTLLCMTCHDNSMNSDYMRKNNWLTDMHVGYTPVIGTSAGKGVFGTADLSGSHPVHVPYASRDSFGQMQAVDGYWQVDVDSSTGHVTFRDADTNQLGDGINTGHPAKLFAENGTAYVECASCHDPHRQTKFAYKLHDGTYRVGGDNSTVHYIRGPYSDQYALVGNNTANGLENSGFCRSCHYEKSPEYIANNGVAK